MEKPRKNYRALNEGCDEETPLSEKTYFVTDRVLLGEVELAPDPRSYKEAMGHPDKLKWQAAMEAELATLHKLGTYELTLLPDGKHVIGSKWVFCIKRDAAGKPIKYKA